MEMILKVVTENKMIKMLFRKTFQTVFDFTVRLLLFYKSNLYCRICHKRFSQSKMSYNIKVRI